MTITPIGADANPDTNAPARTTQVVGAWGVYGRKYTADMIPFDKMTHIQRPICLTSSSSLALAL